MSNCRSCGATIKWIKLESGKSMPVDPDITESLEVGDIFVTENGATVKVTLDNLRELEEGPMGYISHFSTCPQADDWRKKK